MTTTQATIEADEQVPAIWITRDFAATPAQLFAAHTDPNLFARWIGPDGMETDITVWDARDGGEWRFVQRDASGRYAFRGCFHQVTERRIVQTFTYEEDPEGVLLETLTFEDLGDGRTRLRTHSLIDTFEARDAWLRSGMEVGIDQGYAKLDKVVADVTV